MAGHDVMIARRCFPHDRPNIMSTIDVQVSCRPRGDVYDAICRTVSHMLDVVCANDTDAYEPRKTAQL
jgi:hypothetical protein